MLLSVCTVYESAQKIAGQATVNAMMGNGYDNSSIHYRQDISKYFIKIFLDPLSRHCVDGIEEVKWHKQIVLLATR